MIRRIGVDLGTTNILVYLPGKGIVIDEPAVAAMDAFDDKIVAFGEEAKKMLGKTPDSIIAARPLRDGVIANFKVTEAMLRYFLDRVAHRMLEIDKGKLYSYIGNYGDFLESKAQREEQQEQ